MTRLTTRGLAGIEADTTALSSVEGEAGRLRYRGYAIEDLIDLPLEDVIVLLLTGELPDDATRTAFDGWLRAAEQLDAEDLALIEASGRVPRHAMARLQALLPLLHRDGPAMPLTGIDDDAGARVAARVASVVAALIAGPGDAGTGDGDLCARFLRRATGAEPGAAQLDAFRTVQILQLDHGFNAGTFTARVVASTRADTPAALAAAAGALSGVLHGGADQAALQDAREVGDPARAAAFVDACLASGRRVMGMGHREYRVLDPRARIVRELARTLAAGTELEPLQATLEAIEARFSERMAERGKALHANLEFYKSVVYLACGIPEGVFTATFASARCWGWLAHVAEARASGTIIRPAARWDGSGPRQRPRASSATSASSSGNSPVSCLL
ncbi:MAG TPA: citrate/2-methylcitrate synthase [Pseudomonadales bacterium]|nr:citrate/2-methylcitrate synthase [Pseudomonadales bacterium]